MKKLALFLLLSLPAVAQLPACGGAAQWCQVYLAGVAGGPNQAQNVIKTNGWTQPTFVHDTDTILFPSQGNQTQDGTFCNAANPTLPCTGQSNQGSIGNPFTGDIFFTKAQSSGGAPSVFSAPPFDEFYSSAGVGGAFTLIGSGAGAGYLYATGIFKLAVYLQTSIGATDSTISLCAQANCTSSGTATLPPSGTIALDDEAIDYSACTAVNSSNVAVACSSSTATIFTLTVASNCNPKPTGTALCRGQRTNAGWTAAMAHTANLGASGYSYGRAWLATAKVTTPGNAVQFGARINTQGLSGGAWNSTPSFVYGTTSPAGGFDGPPDRHPVGQLINDTKRGKLWRWNGWMENTPNFDIWWMCVSVPSVAITGQANPAFNSCTATDISSPSGWHHMSLSGNPNDTSSLCSQQIAAGNITTCIEGNDESAGAYDVTDDLIFSCCGLGGGALDGAWVWCMSSASGPSASVPACHYDQNASNSASYLQGIWLPVCNTTACRGTSGSPNHGRPGVRDGARVVFDPVDHQVLIVGGRTALQTCSATNPCWTSIAQWNPLTNNYCLSDTSQATATFPSFSAASGCTIGPGTGHTVSGPIPVMNGSLYFPNTAWDSDAGTLVLYKWDEASATTSGLYTYAPATNTWTHTGVFGGPPSNGQAINNSQGFVYDDVQHMVVAVQMGVATNANTVTIWELANSAIAPSQPPLTPTGLTAVAGDAQIVLNWNNVSGASSYKLYRTVTSNNCSNVNNAGCTLVASPVGNSFTDSGLVNGVTYFYVVVAHNSVGDSSPSAQVSATPQAAAEGTPSPTSLTFPKSNLTISTVGQTVTLTSSGSTSLSNIVVAISGDFSQTNTCPSTPLAPGATCTVTVVFTPTAAGTRTGILSFTDSAPDSPQTVTLSGTGVKPNPSLLFGVIVRR